MINGTSLSQTVDAVHAAQFDGRTVTAAERKRIAEWIAARQGLPGAYAGTFAGFPSEQTRGIVVFTGERFTCASARHILGEETSRALRQLRVSQGDVTRALAAADAGLMQALARATEHPRHKHSGFFCCGKCSVGLWRNLLSGGLDRREERLRFGTQHLRSTRDDKHGWRTFPFWYTVLALSEMDSASARGELRHAAPALERAARRPTGATVYARRRHQLAVRTLNHL